MPRSRSYSGRSTGSSGRRRKGSRQRKYTSDNKLNDQPQPQTSHAVHGSHHQKHKGHKHSQSNNQPSTSAQAKSRRDHTRDDDDSDSTSDCSTCSSSSSDSDDVAYQLPARRTYGGVRVSYVPNDALACARKQQQQQQLRKTVPQLDQSLSTTVTSDKDNKNCIIS